MKLISVSAVLLGLAAMSAFGADRTAYDAKCKSCHGPDGAGNPAIAKMMKVEMKALGSKEVQAKSDADLKKIIMEGQGKMKPVAGMDAKTADDIVKFLRTLKS